MRLYEVRQPVRGYVKYIVEARTAQEAVDAVLRGEAGDAVDASETMRMEHKPTARRIADSENPH